MRTLRSFARLFRLFFIPAALSASVSGRDDGKPARFALDTKPFTMQLLWAAALRRAFTLLST